MSSRRPTLRDVSRHTELSVTQVSRALNGHPDVADETRRIVQAAADELGYVPNIQARQLKMPSARTNAVGIVLPATTLSFSYPFVGSLVAGFIQVANEHRVEVDISTVSDESAELLTYKRAIQQRRVDGFLLLRTRRHDERVEFLRSEGVPFATFGRPDNRDGSPAVDDSDDCMSAVVEHLTSLGHTRIGCVAEPTEFARSELRFRSLARAATEAGIEIADDDIAIGDFEQGSGRRGAHQLLDRSDRPTAIVALNDLLGLDVISAAFERGLRVPHDISVTGFDDVPLAALAQPPLTTLRQPGEEIGRELATRLLDHIDGDGEPQVPLLLRPPLVIRQSSARPKTRL